MPAFITRKLLFLILSVSILLSACKQKPQQLSNEEAIAFAKEIEKSIRKGDGDFLDHAFDKDAFIEKMNLPNTSEGKGFGKGIMAKLNLGNKITSVLTDQDNFEFIKHYVKDGKHHVIFRLYNVKESSLNYHDYELIKTHDKCRVADVYIYLSGETLAETMGNLFNTLYTNNSDPGKKELAGMEDLKEVRALIQRGKNAEAKKLYDGLPEYLKKSKTILLLNVVICSSLSNDEYNGAIKGFQEKFPNEPNMNLMMIDGYFLQKDYAKMLAAINALDSQINKDPMLDFYRYVSYDLLQDKSNARLYLTRLVKNMPDFQKGIQELIAVDLKEKNKAESDSLIAIYRKKPRFNQQELTNIINYSALLYP